MSSGHINSEAVSARLRTILIVFVLFAFWGGFLWCLCWLFFRDVHDSLDPGLHAGTVFNGLEQSLRFRDGIHPHADHDAPDLDEFPDPFFSCLFFGPRFESLFARL